MTEVEVYEDLGELKKAWWLLALLGVLSVGFGALLMFWPGKTLTVVATVVGLFTILNGVIRFFTAIFDSRREHRFLLVLVGIAGVVLGVVIMKNPEATIAVIVLLTAVFWLISGMVDFFGGLTRRSDPDAGLRIAFGALAALFGIVILVWPAITVGVFAILTGIYFVFFGILEIVAAFQLKNA